MKNDCDFDSVVAGLCAEPDRAPVSKAPADAEFRASGWEQAEVAGKIRAMRDGNDLPERPGVFDGSSRAMCEENGREEVARIEFAFKADIGNLNIKCTTSTAQPSRHCAAVPHPTLAPGVSGAATGFREPSGLSLDFTMCLIFLDWRQSL